MIRMFLLAASLFSVGYVAAKADTISTQYIEDRFYVITPQVNGVSATLLLDSSHGANDEEGGDGQEVSTGWNHWKRLVGQKDLAI